MSEVTERDRLDWMIIDNAEKAIRIAELETERDESIAAFSELALQRDRAEAERDRLREALLAIVDLEKPLNGKDFPIIIYSDAVDIAKKTLEEETT